MFISFLAPLRLFVASSSEGGSGSHKSTGWFMGDIGIVVNVSLQELVIGVCPEGMQVSPHSCEGFGDAEPCKCYFPVP